MIKNRINALFSFIEFLHSNIDNFKGYDILINELYALNIERNKVRDKKTFTDKLKYDEVQAKIKSKFEIINENIIELIKDKSNELNICDWTKTETLWNYNILEISELKENFSTNDIPEILKNKTKYLEFRKKTNCDYFQTFFFSDLDKILKVLFDFFNESNENEFKAFEVKKIEVNDISEAVELLHKGHNNFLIPASNTKLKQRLSKSLSDINFFQIYFEINNNKEYNNDSFIKPENWDNLKDIFYSQRMEKYNSSFTQIEKIKLELEDLENLNINKTDYKVLKERYKDFLDVILSKLLEKRDLNKISTIDKSKAKDYKKELWFTTGIPLATGEAFELYRKYKDVKGCFERICEDLGILKGRPYISTTINDPKPKEVFNKNGIKMPMKIDDKNTFANKDKLQKLHSYLTENDLPLGAEFLEKYNQIVVE